ncbi:MAG: AraC family transcriptional regulator [Succinatimonas sp.]|nr:AraC family transcriptional regulator [Succinatimonas sp.]
MNVRFLLLELFSCVQLPCFIVSADGKSLEDEYLPHGIKQHFDSNYVLKSAQNFERNVADPLYFSLNSHGKSFAAIKLCDLRTIIIVLPDSTLLSEIQPNFSQNAIANRLQAVNLFLRMLSEICLMSDLPNKVYTSKALDCEQYVPEEFSDLTSKLPKHLQPHNQYRTEVFIQDAVIEGDLNKLKFAFDLPAHGEHGILGPNEDRSLRNHCHLVNVLCSRAAIRAGVSPEEAYTLSDKLFMSVELIDPKKLNFELRTKVAKSFLLQVKNYKEQQASPNHNTHVNEAVDFIRRHLFDNINISSIASHCNLSTDYLQKIFRNHQGITISAFILKEKLKASQELLTDSHLKATEIASLLHFSSASHFNRSFKELFGIPPALYRRQNRKKVNT